MANKRIHDLVTEISSAQDEDHDWLAIDGDGDGTSQDKLQKMTFANLAQEVLDILGITASAAELNKLDGVTSTTAELNILDGVTADKDEINILDGASLNTTELNYVGGVTSAIQTQLNDKMEVDKQEADNASSTSASSPTISAETQVLRLDASSNTVAARLSPMTVGKSESIIVKVLDATNNCTITTAGNGFVDPAGNTGTTITFDTADEFVYLKSSTIVGGYWMILGGKGYVLSG